MANLREKTKSILGLITMIYFIGGQISIAVFTYQDIKQHDSFLRAIFLSPIIGFLKAPVWPYFAYTNNVNSKPTKISDKNVNAFFHALKGLERIRKLNGDLAISENPKIEAQKIVYWTNVTYAILKNCDELELEKIYSGWGKSTSLLRSGVELALNSSERETPGTKQQISESISKFQTWTQANFSEVNEALKKYDISPFPKYFEEKELEMINASGSNNESVI